MFVVSVWSVTLYKQAPCGPSSNPEKGAATAPKEIAAMMRRLIVRVIWVAPTVHHEDTGPFISSQRNLRPPLVPLRDRSFARGRRSQPARRRGVVASPALELRVEAELDGLGRWADR